MDSPIEVVKKTWATLVDSADPRVEQWTLMSSFWPVACILAVYIYFCTNLGPRLMNDRKPFVLKTPIIAFNIFQIFANAYLVAEAARQIWLPRKYNLFCEPVAYDSGPISLLIASYVHYFFLLKVVDLADTIFMVLRKKDRQISFLHLYHHAGMTVATWVGAKYLAGGHVIFFGTVNCIVHIVMYAYYLYTVISPEAKKSIWWKRHLTEMQLVQFVLVGLHALSGIIYPGCEFPKIPLAIFMVQNVFMFVLFWDFYDKSYLRKPKEKGGVKKE